MKNLANIIKLVPKLYAYPSIRRFSSCNICYRSEETSRNENSMKTSNKNLESARKTEQRYTEYSTASLGIIPDYFNPLISDLDEVKTVENIVAKELNVEYLGPLCQKSKPEIIRGTICSDAKNLPFVNLVCQCKERDPVNVIFLLATGSPSTYMTDKTFSFIYGTSEIENCTDIIKVDDYIMSIKRSSFPNSTFKGLNVLGLDFLTNDRLNLIKLEKKHFFMYKSSKK